MVSIVKMLNAVKKTFQNAPGESISVDTIGRNGSQGSAELYTLPGIISLPQDEEFGIVKNVKGVNIVIATNNYKLNIVLEKGETQVFSADANGQVLGTLKLDKDGKAIFHKGERSAAAFDKLKAGFDQLRDDFNGFLTHVHPGVTPGSGSTAPQTTTGPSSASIDDSEVDTVLLP